MPANIYHFEDHWHVPFPVEKVWQVLSQPQEYPRWWRGVYLSAEPLDGDGEAKGGKRVAVVARGWLPYKLKFTIETLTLKKPQLIEFKATGDFVTDVSRWVLKPEGDGTSVALEWNPRVEKPVVRLLSPILKPLFRWNHNWTMKRGQRQIVEYMESVEMDRRE